MNIREGKRLFSERRKLSFEVILAQEIPSIFTQMHHQLLRVYRDGARSSIHASQLLNISPSGEWAISKSFGCYYFSWLD